jgi:hypothetical protein
MHRLSARLTRLVPIIVLAAALAACAAERPPLGPPVISPTRLGKLGPAPVKGAQATFTFQTVTSVPGEFRYALEDDLKSAAAARGLAIVTADDPTVTYQVKGYLSAVGDVNGILLVYVWDVFDRSGTRLHRFSSQQSAKGRGADPWSGVTTDMIATAAEETIDELVDWARG